MGSVGRAAAGDEMGRVDDGTEHHRSEALVLYHSDSSQAQGSKVTFI